jgi:cell division protein FtsB
MARRTLLLLLAAFWLLLLYRIALGDGGMTDYRRLHQKVNAQQKETERLRARNAALAAEVADLKSGVAAIEARARADLGMILPEETFYLITPR